MAEGFSIVRPGSPNYRLYAYMSLTELIPMLDMAISESIEILPTVIPSDMTSLLPILSELYEKDIKGDVDSSDDWKDKMARLYNIEFSLPVRTVHRRDDVRLHASNVVQVLSKDLVDFIAHDREHFELSSFKPVGGHNIRIGSHLRRDASGQTYRQFSDETLRKAVIAWPDNLAAAIPLYSSPWKMVFELLGGKTESRSLSDIVAANVGALSNRFFDLVYSGKVSLKYEGETDVVVPADASHTVALLIYNLQKNALKHAEMLDEKYKDFNSAEIIVSSYCEDGKVSILVSQNFEGIDLYEYAALGAKMVAEGRTEGLSAEQIKRYTAWLESRFGIGFNDLMISDITALPFLPYVSGAELDSETSGIGLFAARQLSTEKNGHIHYFFQPKSPNYAGFLVDFELAA